MPVRRSLCRFAGIVPDAEQRAACRHRAASDAARGNTLFDFSNVSPLDFDIGARTLRATGRYNSMRTTTEAHVGQMVDVEIAVEPCTSAVTAAMNADSPV